MRRRPLRKVMAKRRKRAGEYQRPTSFNIIFTKPSPAALEALGARQAGLRAADDEYTLVATPSRPRGQRRTPDEPTYCPGGDPDCAGCVVQDAAAYSRQRQSDAPRPAIGLNFKPFALRYS